MPSSTTKWNFDSHCTKQIPIVSTQKYFGYESNEFGVASSFKILTPEAVKISLDIIKTNEKIQEKCRFNNVTTKDHLKQSPNTYAYRNISGVNEWFRDMLSCKKLEKYLCDISGEPVELEYNTWIAGHVNVQESREEDENNPNIAWHKDTACYAMLIILNEMPENPKGGETLTKKKNGEIAPIKYKTQGDSVFFKGSVIEHCGMPGKNFNKYFLPLALEVGS